MNTEFNGRPEQQPESEAQFWRSLEELLPIFEREGIQLRLEPHPDDFIEDGREAVDMVRGIDSPIVTFLYCAPHTFHMGGDIAGHHGIRRRPAHPPARRRLASTTAPRPACATSSTRPARPRACTSTSTSARARSTGTLFFGTLERLEFDGIMTACVFAWEDRARESSRFMREEMGRRTHGWKHLG